MSRRYVLKALLCGVAVLPFSASAAREQSLAPAQDAAITRLLSGQQSRTRAPGIALIIRRKGDVVYARGLGVDGEGASFTVNTPVYLGSQSKSFTATAVMQLVANNRRDLDRPVITYLPDFVLKDPRGARKTVHSAAAASFPSQVA